MRSLVAPAMHVSTDGDHGHRRNDADRAPTITTTSCRHRRPSSPFAVPGEVGRITWTC